MPEETEFLAKSGTPDKTAGSATTPLPESHFRGISIRAYLAVMVVATMCAIALYQVWKTGVLDESFKVAYGLVIGLYFGQNQKK